MNSPKKSDFEADFLGDIGTPFFLFNRAFLIKLTFRFTLLKLAKE